jgi:hypothetical protein
MRWSKSVKRYLILVTIFHFAVVMLAGVMDSRRPLRNPVSRTSMAGVQPPAPAPLSEKDQSILTEVIAYGEDDGIRGLRAWERLQAEPDLVDSLSRLRSALQFDGYAQPMIALVNCRMKNHYFFNRGIVLNAFSGEIVYSGMSKLLGAKLIEKLIRAGDPDALKFLFDGLRDADYGTRQELGAFFISELDRAPEDFLLQVNSLDDYRRQQIYFFLHSNIGRGSDLERLRIHVLSATKGTTSAPVALEMFRAFDNVRPMLTKPVK